MAAIVIDRTYFQQGELYLPNSINVDANTSGSNVLDELDVFLDKYERELLIGALGIEQYETLIARITNDPTLAVDPVDAKWKDLVFGSTYDSPYETGVKLRFEGLKGYAQQSIIAQFIFCKYMRDNDLTYTTVGTVRDTAKNASSVSATPKYVDVWNKFILGYQGVLRDNEYPRIIFNKSGNVGLDYFSQENYNRSLYQFITDKNETEEVYEARFFKPYKLKTSMGI